MRVNKYTPSTEQLLITGLFLLFIFLPSNMYLLWGPNVNIAGNVAMFWRFWRQCWWRRL